MNRAIDEINKRIEAYLKGRALRTRFFGLSEAINYDSEGTVIPAIVMPSGDVYTSLFDDRFSVGAYHKLNSKSYSTDASNGYGNARNVTETADVSLVCYGMREFVDVYELEGAIAQIIASVSIADRSERITCEVSSSLFNRNQVFQAEYSGIPMFLQPNVFLFRVTYKISTARRTCN